MFSPSAQIWIVSHFKIIMVVFIVLTFLILALYIKRIIQKRQVYKQYLSQPLENHLDDALNINRVEKARRYDTDTYIAKEMMRYAEALALSQLKKRDRFTKEGELTPVAKKATDETKISMVEAFTANGVLSQGYAEFIRDYRPWYTVKDFFKTITEYMAFCTKPEMFQKVVREEDPVVQTGINNEPSAFISEAQASDIDSYEEDYVTTEEENMYYEEDDLGVFQTSATVDRSVIITLTQYAEKLAKKTCSKKRIPCEENGVKTAEYTNECRDNYNRLSKIFFDGNYFNSDFVVWANDNYPSYGVARFGDLIAPYLRNIKQK